MKKIFLLLYTLLILIITIKAQETVVKANHFISLLTNEQKLETLFPFDDNERYNFHFVPIERKGITFNELNPEQTKAEIGRAHV